MNTMTFRLRKEDASKNLKVTGMESTLQQVMRQLFSSDDYVFSFAEFYSFENISPMPADTQELVTPCVIRFDVVSHVNPRNLAINWWGFSLDLACQG